MFMCLSATVRKVLYNVALFSEFPFVRELESLSLARGSIQTTDTGK